MTNDWALPLILVAVFVVPLAVRWWKSRGGAKAIFPHRDSAREGFTIKDRSGGGLRISWPRRSARDGHDDVRSAGVGTRNPQEAIREWSFVGATVEIDGFRWTNKHGLPVTRHELKLLRAEARTTREQLRYRGIPDRNVIDLTPFIIRGSEGPLACLMSFREGLETEERLRAKLGVRMDRAAHENSRESDYDDVGTGNASAESMKPGPDMWSRPDATMKIAGFTWANRYGRRIENDEMMRLAAVAADTRKQMRRRGIPDTYVGNLTAYITDGSEGPLECLMYFRAQNGYEGSETEESLRARYGAPSRSPGQRAPRRGGLFDDIE